MKISCLFTIMFWYSVTSGANQKLFIAKSDFYKQEIEDKKDNPKETWKILNNLMGRNTEKKSINNIKVNGHSITTLAETANHFNEYFVEIGPKLAAPSNGSSNNKNSFEDYLPRVTSRFSFTLTNSTKVTSLLEKCFPSKAIGLDGVSTELLKFAAPAISNSLTYIIL